MSFIGLTNTLLDDTHASMIAGVLVNLRPRGQDKGKSETLEMLRMVFQPATRRLLEDAAERVGVRLLLSLPNGPALRGCGLYP